ncbi:MAG: hypothetical protein MUE51_10395 [Thermoleophilia bacterium]|nr:hypothetical protein [Thermoleophilia bacterium]
MRGADVYSAFVVLLSSALVVLGVVQIARAASGGAGPVAYLVGVLLLGAGLGRLFLWYRGRRGEPRG